MAVFLDRGGYWWSSGQDLPDKSSAGDILLPSNGAQKPATQSDDPSAFRLNLMQTVWGPGFVGPGDGLAAKELLGPLSLTRSTNLLDLSAGLGGAANFLSDRYGVAITAFEQRYELVAHATLKDGSDPRRPPIQHYDADTIDLPRGRYDGIYAQHLTCRLAEKERLLREVYRALKPEGYFGFVDLVVGDERTVRELRDDSPAFASHGNAMPWRLTQYLDCLGAIGFTCNRVIDQSARFRTDILRPWQRVTDLGRRGAYTKAELLMLVDEANDWLETLRLVQAGLLRVIRFETTI